MNHPRWDMKHVIFFHLVGHYPAMTVYGLHLTISFFNTVHFVLIIMGLSGQ